MHRQQSARGRGHVRPIQVRGRSLRRVRGVQGLVHQGPLRQRLRLGLVIMSVLMPKTPHALLVAVLLAGCSTTPAVLPAMTDVQSPKVDAIELGGLYNVTVVHS